MLRLFIDYQVVGVHGVQSDQVGRSRLETQSSLKDVVESVGMFESIGCCDYVNVVRVGSMADGHPRALAGSAEASVAVAEIRDATRKLILTTLEISRQVPPSLMT